MALLEFVRRLLHEGSARLSEPPRLHPKERDATLAVLRDAHHDAMLDVAGVAPSFSPDVGLRTAEWAANACWLLLHRGGTPAEVESALPLFSPGADAADHATADVVLRFVAGFHRRARVIAPGPLAERIEGLLRRWPLSGVLTEIEAPPLTPVEFGGHGGLLLLYAERFAARPRPEWRADGPAAEYLELVLAERKLS
jgi:hypothetical protein